MCEHRGWLLAAAGRALSPCHRDGLGGVATRRGWVPATSEGAIRRLIDDAAAHGSAALVVDTTSSAAVLADYAWRNADRLTWTTITDELLARLRILNGRDTDLAGNATRAANRLRDALLAVSPALERAVGDRLVSVSGLRAALAKWPTPSALRAAGKVRVRGVIAKRSKRTAAKLADQIWAALAAQTVTVVAEATWGETISDLAADLDRIIDRRERLEADIGAAFLEHPLGKVLNSMCGFGPRTGARTLAEIGDPHRFANPARLAAYAPTSSWPCSKPKPPTNHASSNPKPQKTYPERLDNKTGTPPHSDPRVRGHRRRRRCAQRLRLAEDRRQRHAQQREGLGKPVLADETKLSTSNLGKAKGASRRGQPLPVEGDAPPRRGTRTSSPGRSPRADQSLAL